MAARTSIVRQARLLTSPGATCMQRRAVMSRQFRSFSTSSSIWQRRFTKDHEWVELSSDKQNCTVGITKYAADAIGDVTWIEMPEADATFAAEDTLATIESVKAANEIYAPLSGTVTEVNQKLDEDPKLVNQDAEGEAWIVKLKVEAVDEFEGLLDETAYKALVAEAKKDDH